MKVDYIDHMGTDLSVVNAARVSFHKESDWVYSCDCGDPEFCEWSGKSLPKRDEKLISYLARNGHWTPFGHTAITVRVKAPVFVRTQCFKHKVGFVENEVSRRYVTEEPKYYRPWYFRGKPENAKQGSSDEEIHMLYPSGCDPVEAKLAYEVAIMACDQVYEDMIKNGVAPEQARMVLPQSMYTEWYWTGSLMSFARFYNLRSDSHAQQEIQEVAHMIEEVVRPLFPVSWEALTNDRSAENEG